MKKQELIKEMKQSVGGACFMNTTQFAAFLGRDRKNARACIKTAVKVNGNDYFIPDLAEDIMSLR